MILIMIIPAQELMTIPADMLMMMIIPAHVLMKIMPATELKNIPANVLMTMMIFYKLEVSHVQLPTVREKYHVKHDDNTLSKMVYGPTYVPYNEDGQKLLLLQTTDMS